MKKLVFLCVTLEATCMNVRLPYGAAPTRTDETGKTYILWKKGRQIVDDRTRVNDAIRSNPFFYWPIGKRLREKRSEELRALANELYEIGSRMEVQVERMKRWERRSKDALVCYIIRIAFSIDRVALII
jgi:hypothetical protein